MAKGGWKGFRSERELTPQQELMSRKQVAHRTEQSISISSSPMVPAAELQSYEQVLPGLAERVVVMVEKEQDLRHDIVRRRSKAQVWVTVLGQVFGFLLSGGIIAIGGRLLLLGQDVSGFVAIITALTTLIIPFLIGRRADKPAATQQ